MRSTIERLFGIYSGATISVVGSGPTAPSFRPQDCDVSIGVNGAALLGSRFDYFFYMTRDATEHEWFDRDCSEARVVGARIATLDRFLYPTQFDGAIGPRQVYDDPPDLPEPVNPHHIFVASGPSQQCVQALIERRSNSLMTHGTSSGQAVQLAFLMGAAVVRLYGCPFTTNTSGRREHYFYDVPQGQGGWIGEDHILFMNLYLSIVRQGGTRIIVHGPTALNQFDEIVDP